LTTSSANSILDLHFKDVNVVPTSTNLLTSEEDTAEPSSPKQNTSKLGNGKTVTPLTDYE
jgi:hypothetical protein